MALHGERTGSSAVYIRQTLSICYILQMTAFLGVRKLILKKMN